MILRKLQGEHGLMELMIASEIDITLLMNIENIYLQTDRSKSWGGKS